MTESDRDRRIEEELQRRERNVRGERAAARPQAPEPARTPPAPGRQAGLAAGPAPQAPDVEALFHRLEAQLDDMEGRVTAGIDAVTGTVAPVMEVAATGGGAPALSPGREGGGAPALSPGREGGGRRRQRPGAGPRRSGRPPEPDPPARAKARQGGGVRAGARALRRACALRPVALRRHRDRRSHGRMARPCLGTLRPRTPRLRPPRRTAGQGHALPGLRPRPRTTVAPRDRDAAAEPAAAAPFRHTARPGKSGPRPACRGGG